MTIARQEAAAAPVVAARAYIVDTLDNGAPGYNGLSAIHQADPLLYGRLLEGNRQHDATAIERMVRRVHIIEDRTGAPLPTGWRGAEPAVPEHV